MARMRKPKITPVKKMLGQFAYHREIVDIDYWLSMFFLERAAPYCDSYEETKVT